MGAEKLPNACGGVRGGDKRSIPALCARQQSSRRRARAGRAAGWKGSSPTRAATRAAHSGDGHQGRPLDLQVEVAAIPKLKALAK